MERMKSMDGLGARPPIRAFTLIELLIVIAIILILISIALPNFLEAQLRAKVLSAKAEMKGLEIALRSYQLDHRIYPADNFERNDFWHLPIEPYIVAREGDRSMWAQLTTPNPYISKIPLDDFLAASKGWDNLPRDPNNNVYRLFARGWRCLAAGNTFGTGNTYSCHVPSSAKGKISGSRFDPELGFSGQWLILSPGPDRVHDAGEWAMYRLFVNQDPSYIQVFNQANKSHPIYSPTNGTVSKGDINVFGS